MAKYRIVEKYHHAMCDDYFTIQRKFLFFWIPTIGEWYSSPGIGREGSAAKKRK